MKYTVIALAICGAAYVVTEQRQRPQPASVKTERVVKRESLRLVYFQDLSRSICTNGVEIITGADFGPYCSDINRDIDLYFSIIRDSGAGKPLSVHLPVIDVSCPVQPNVSTMSAYDCEIAKREYQGAFQKYLLDSVAFMGVRYKAYNEFVSRVDSILRVYRGAVTGKGKLYGLTDIESALAVADKVFNYSEVDSATNVLILNSDGESSFRLRNVRLRNPATVILVNASGKQYSDIDSIVSKVLPSTEMAVKYSLTIKN